MASIISERKDVPGRGRGASMRALLMAFALALFAAHAQAQPWSFSRLPDAAAWGRTLEEGDLKQAREWLDRGLDPNFVADRIGTGLMIAAWHGNLPLMELLVDHGADVNRRNALGEQALMHAAWQGQDAAVEWLLAHGAKLEQAEGKWNALHYAAFAGKDTVVRSLVGHGADVNARSPNGSTALMMAVYDNHESTVRTLLQLGADRRLANDRGEGAMDWAFKYQRIAIARLVGSSAEFAAAADKPRAAWAETPHSLPAPAVAPAAGQPPAEPDPVADLLVMRKALVQRRLYKQVKALDKRIAYLRARRAREEFAAHPSKNVPRTVLEISAKRGAPTEQKARLINDPPENR